MEPWEFQGSKWFETQSDPQTAWNSCNRGDYLLYIAGMLCIPNSLLHKQIVFAACQCARLSLKYIPDERPLSAIEITERWTRGEATLEEVKIAERDAWKAENKLDARVQDAISAAIGASRSVRGGPRVASGSARASGWETKEWNLSKYNKVLYECADIARKYISYSEIAQNAIRKDKEDTIRYIIE